MGSPKKIKRIEVFQQAPENAPPDSYFIGMVDGKLQRIPNNFQFREKDSIEIKTYTRDVDDE